MFLLINEVPKCVYWKETTRQARTKNRLMQPITQSQKPVKTSYLGGNVIFSPAKRALLRDPLGLTSTVMIF